MRIGILGAGRIGRVHIANLSSYFPAVEVAGISDIDRTRAEAVAKEFRIPKASDRIDDIIEDESIHAVVICSSTDTHADLICRAAQKRKHVFCEKPVDLELAAVNKVLEVVEEYGVKFQVGFNRRFDKNPRAIKTAIQEGRIGEPHLLKITSRDPAPPPVEYIRVSGGIFKDMMIHDFDMARFLLDAEVVEVSAQGTVRVSADFADAGDVDTAVVTLRFADGTLAVIDNSRQALYGYDQRIEVFGSKGVATAANEHSHGVEFGSADGVCRATPLYFFLERYKDAYVEELRAFFDAIEEDKEVSVNGNDGKQPLCIAEAALRSLEEKRTVSLSEIEA